MNLQRLKAAEAFFLKQYPGGFLHPEMVALGKKHKMDKMVDFAQEAFAKRAFRDTTTLLENIVATVSRSSMISLFEKPKFRDAVRAMDSKAVNQLTGGLKDLLHGNQERGLNHMVSALAPFKLAKWSLVTIIPNYYAPNDEVFVKPTTAKGVIEFFQLEGLHYTPTPNWPFYTAYREAIHTMRTAVHDELAPSNAAFSGFLMMSMKP